MDKMDDYRSLWIESFNEEAVTADGFDDAIIGMAERSGQLPVVAYDWSKCIQILMERDGMDYEDAEEFFAVNVIGGWVGDSTPIYVTLYKDVIPRVEETG